MKIIKFKILIISIWFLCILNNEFVCSVSVVSKAGLQLKEASPTKYPVVYQRFIRRRPSGMPKERYIDEYIEIWEKPPNKIKKLTDEEVDELIECDFNRHLPKCKWN